MGYQFQFGPVLDNIDFLILACKYTLELAFFSLLLSVVIGIVAGQARLSRFLPIRILAGAYVDFSRTTPLLVQLVWIFYVLPIAFHIQTTTFQSGVLALSLNYGAFFAEIFRAGVTSIAVGQTEAGAALGMSQLQILRRIIYPLVFRRMLPPIGSMTVSLMKDTALCSVIGIPELMNSAQNLTSQTFRPLEVLTTVAMIYFVMTYPIALATGYLHKRSIASQAG